MDRANLLGFQAWFYHPVCDAGAYNLSMHQRRCLWQCGSKQNLHQREFVRMSLVKTWEVLRTDSCIEWDLYQCELPSWLSVTMLGAPEDRCAMLKNRTHGPLISPWSQVRGTFLRSWPCSWALDERSHKETNMGMEGRYSKWGNNSCSGCQGGKGWQS